MEGDVEDGELSDSDSDMPGAGSPGDLQQVRKGTGRRRGPGVSRSRATPGGGPRKAQPGEGRRGPAAAGGRGGLRPAGEREALDGPAGERGGQSRGGGTARAAGPGGPSPGVTAYPVPGVREPACSSGARSFGKTACVAVPLHLGKPHASRGGDFCCCWPLDLVSKGVCSPVPLVASGTMQTSGCKNTGK